MASQLRAFVDANRDVRVVCPATIRNANRARLPSVVVEYCFIFVKRSYG
jgi:hypothetical protein